MQVYQCRQSQVLVFPRLFDASTIESLLTLVDEVGFESQLFYGGESRERAVVDDARRARLFWSMFPALPELSQIYGPVLRAEPDVDDFDVYRSVGLNARLRFYRYVGHARLLPHHDLSYDDGKHRSFLTVLVYLNDDVEGGQTSFGELEIAPEVGTCVVFPHELRHEGLPVTQGCKVLLRTDVMFECL